MTDRPTEYINLIYDVHWKGFMYCPIPVLIDRLQQCTLE